MNDHMRPLPPSGWGVGGGGVKLHKLDWTPHTLDWSPDVLVCAG